MKKILFNLGLILLTVSVAYAGKFDIGKYAVGRVRFVEGNDATFTFKNKKVNVDIDYLVLLGGTFESQKSKIELVDLNNDTFWFDKESFFNFESYDSVGDNTTLFLGKGSFVCSTKKPFIVITSSGSVLIPENGKYVITKPEFGKTKTEISIIEGEKPSLIKGKGLFAKIRIKNKNNKIKLMSWMEQREDDWHTTLIRCRIFSNSSILSPYMANTKPDGTISWVKVDYVKPLVRAKDMINGNEFFYKGADILKASGITSNLVNKLNDDQLALFFSTNKYNGIKWAWNVERGWHAEFYYEPLFEEGSSYLSVYDRDFIKSLRKWLRAKQELVTFPVKKARWYEYGDSINNLTYRLDKSIHGVYYNNFNGGDDGTGNYGTSNQNVIDKYSSKLDKEVKAINIRSNAKPIKGIVKLRQNKLVKSRMVSDISLDDERKAVKLSVKDADVKNVNVVIPGKLSNTKPMVRPSSPNRYPVKVIKPIDSKNKK